MDGMTEDPGDPQRPFLEHLEELRRCLIRSLLVALVGVIAGAAAFRPISDQVRGQLRQAFEATGHPEDFPSALFTLTPTAAVGMVFEFSLAAGLFLALPYLLVQLWAFVSPALRARERRVAGWVLTAGPLFFVGGFLFSFFHLMPLTAECLLRISYHYGFAPRWTAESYYGFFLVLNLAFATCFELPLVMVILSAMGLVRPAMYGRYRRHWIAASFLIGGLLPPPELVSMFIQAGTLIALYEVGILFSRLFVPRQDPLQP